MEPAALLTRGTQIPAHLEAHAWKCGSTFGSCDDYHSEFYRDYKPRSFIDGYRGTDWGSGVDRIEIWEPTTGESRQCRVFLAWAGPKLKRRAYLQEPLPIRLNPTIEKLGRLIEQTSPQQNERNAIKQAENDARLDERRSRIERNQQVVDDSNALLAECGHVDVGELTGPSDSFVLVSVEDFAAVARLAHQAKHRTD